MAKETEQCMSIKWSQHIAMNSEGRMKEQQCRKKEFTILTKPVIKGGWTECTIITKSYVTHEETLVKAKRRNQIIQ